MATGCCEICDAQNVPGSIGSHDCPDGFFCFICQGDEFDPYCEMEIDCTCDGEGCRDCSHTGRVVVETQPITLTDLEDMHQ